MSLPPGLALYRAVTGALEPFAPALLGRRARRGKEDPGRLPERLGRTAIDRPPGPLAWLHGASVGEGLSLLPLVQALRARRPDLQLLVTSGTTTSAELLGRRLPADVIHQYAPLDTPKSARRFLDHWRPDLVVLAESELWPNLILGAEDRGARVALVSARLSARSLAGWGRQAGSARRLFGAFDLVLAQDDATAAALAGLGARDDGRLNLKLTGEPLPAEEAALARARAAAGDRPVFLAASTHPGEEALVLDAFARLGRGLLVIVPRHPSRGAEIAALAAERFPVRRQGAGETFDGAAPVYVADRLGELGLWFRLARAAFVGGSLVPGIGGHNPLEPARLGCPSITGPHLENWQSVYDALGDRIARVSDAEGLAGAFDAPPSPEPARALAEAGAASVDEAAERLAGLVA